MSLQVIYYDVPEAKAVYTGMPQDFCDVRLLGERRQPQTPYEPIITLEPDSWSLDGSRVALKAYAPPPFWGRVLSDDIGEFAEAPTITVQLSQPCSASGISAVFWEETNQWCCRLTLRWYRGDTLLCEETLEPNAPRLLLQKLVEDFDRLDFVMERWSKPYRFPRLTYLQLGQEILFSEDSLVGVKLLTEHDPTGCQLSADTMTVEVRCDHAIAPRENQLLQLWRDGQLLAAHRLTGSRRTGASSYILSAQSIIGVLAEQVYIDLQNGNSAHEVMYMIMGTYDGWEMDERLCTTDVTGWIPVCSRREALQQLAFLLGARVLACDGIIRLLPPETQVTGEFLPGDIFSGAQLETDSVLVRLEVIAHSYTGSDQERLLLDNQQVNGEHVRFVFDTPCQDYRIEGGEITGAGTNYVTVTANGNIRLYGKPYTHTGVLHSRSLPGSGRVLSIDSATLVNGSNVEGIMDRLMAVSQLRQKLTQEVILGSQFAGQRVTSPTPWGSTLEGIITSVEANLTPQGQTATVTIQGSEANS